MRTLITAAVVALFTLTCSAVDARAQQRAEELLWECEGRGSAPELLGKAMCVGYISGIMDGLQLAEYATKSKTRLCLPPTGISNDQAVRIFTKFLNDNPREMSESARVTVYVALAVAFPCPQPGK